jgi:hypothetical protein
MLLALVTPGGGRERTYVSGNTALTIDGKACGFVKSLDGGAIFADVINEPAGPNYFVKKHIGQPRFEDFTLQVGFGMTKAVYELIATSWKANPKRFNGSFIAANYDLMAQSERQFSDALLTETTIPAMDGASKEPAYITLKIAPTLIRVQKAEGKIDAAPFGKNEQKLFLPSNFRLEIEGLDCTKVNKIDSFTVKQPALQDDIGSARDQARQPGKIEFPNLKITLAESAAESWLKWHESFVVKGENNEANEKKGTLTFLMPNRQKELAQIRFFNMGICRMQPDKSESGADQVKRVTVELYVERMDFEYAGGEIGSGSTGTTPPATAPAVRSGPRASAL